MGFGKQGKGAFISREQRRSVQLLRGTSKQRKCSGTWNPGKQIFEFWGKSKFISAPLPMRASMFSGYTHNHIVPSDIG